MKFSNDPTLATSHARDALGLVSRFEQFGVRIRSDDLVVVVMRREQGGVRRVVEISQLDPDDELERRLGNLRGSNPCSFGEILWGGAST